MVLPSRLRHRRFKPESWKSGKMLSIITNRGPIVKQAARSSNMVILGATWGQQASAHYREWRFPTRAATLPASYNERWIEVARGNKLRFDQAYMQLYKEPKTGFGQVRVLAIDCDPFVPESEEHAEFRRGPHLHVKCAPHPISRAHFALTHDLVDRVLESLDSATAAISAAVHMLNEEVLKHPEIDDLSV